MREGITSSLSTVLTCFFSPYSTFNDEKIKVKELQKANHET